MEINRHTVELARTILDAACNGQSAIDLDDQAAATIRSLSLLTAGDPIQFCQWQQPPLEVLTGLLQSWKSRPMGPRKRVLFEDFHGYSAWLTEIYHRCCSERDLKILGK